MFANPDEMLYPNQFVNARLLVSTMQDAVRVPVPAVQHGEPGTFVYLINADNTVSVRPIKVGPTDGNFEAVLSGLQPGRPGGDGWHGSPARRRCGDATGRRRPKGRAAGSGCVTRSARTTGSGRATRSRRATGSGPAGGSQGAARSITANPRHNDGTARSSRSAFSVRCARALTAA